MKALSVRKSEDVIERAGEILRELGFGSHESIAILALNRIESGTVADLSAATGIHHANLYSILDSLEDRGLVVSSNERPRVYRFAPIAHLRDMLATKVDQLAKDLDQIQSERESKDVVPTLVYTIRGKSNVQAKILSMIGRARKRILLTTPSLSQLGEYVYDSLEIAAKSGVIVKTIFGKGPIDCDFQMQQHVKADTLAIDLVIDGEEALISMPDLSVCGWADNALVSQQLEGFLDQTWNTLEKA